MFFYFRLKEEKKTLETKRQRLLKMKDKHVIYQHYLDRVIECAEEFHEIREVIARHDTLTATHCVCNSRKSFFL